MHVQSGQCNRCRREMMTLPRDDDHEVLTEQLLVLGAGLPRLTSKPQDQLMPMRI